jgi:hypothetical protein
VLPKGPIARACWCAFGVNPGSAPVPRKTYAWEKCCSLTNGKLACVHMKDLKFTPLILLIIILLSYCLGTIFFGRGMEAVFLMTVLQL